MTPAEEQYWQHKRVNMDLVLFFKVSTRDAGTFFYALLLAPRRLRLSSHIFSLRLFACVVFLLSAGGQILRVVRRGCGGRCARIGAVLHGESEATARGIPGGGTRSVGADKADRRVSCDIASCSPSLSLSLSVLSLFPCLLLRGGAEKYAQRLVALGYKIGQVDQTETPAQLAESNAKLKGSAQKKRKIVRREMSEVIAPGTIVESDVFKSADANYLFALAERELSLDEMAAQQQQQEASEAASSGMKNEQLQQLEEQNAFVVEFGFCYVDCMTGKFVLGQRRDDKQRSFLKTLLGQVAPREILTPRNGLTLDTQHVLKQELAVSVIKNERDFWTPQRTVKELSGSQYYDELKQRRHGADAAAAAADGGQYAHWPKALQKVINDKQDLALSAMGAVVDYLRRTRHDVDLVSQGHVSRYIDLAVGQLNKMLVLDGQTLTNLEIVKNQDGGIKGTLLEFVDRCVTAFGKRKLRTWITAPLLDVDAIEQRQQAVSFWMQHVS